MYRTPDETPRCACCHSEQLTDITKFDPSEGYARVHFDNKRPADGVFASRRVQYTVDRARICIACGHVMHFVSARQRAELAKRLDELAAVSE